LVEPQKHFAARVAPTFAVSWRTRISSVRRCVMTLTERSAHWLKTKSPTAPVVRREAEEDWSQLNLRMVCCVVAA
jgi:hypothetical protein